MGWMGLPLPGYFPISNYLADTLEATRNPDVSTGPLDFPLATGSQHTRRHERPYRCQECNLGFSEPRDLRWHRETHQHQRVLVDCPRCGKKLGKRQGNIQALYHQVLQVFGKRE
ncbi:hypothetical protein F4778DRAFT_746584 [Xylariomycetidae sp. FL2044]|nr:hypothetical protein F4778DRAFT_746584 [Xylariomycetidae sp. FL2044]